MPGKIGKKWILVVAAVWLLIALGMLLAPSPVEWGAFGKKIGTPYHKMKSVLQPAAHVLLMAACTIILMQAFATRPLFTALLYSLGISVALAAVLEMSQSLLPAGFSRQCDPLDLLPAVIGSLFGGLTGLCMRSRPS